MTGVAVPDAGRLSSKSDDEDAFLLLDALREFGFDVVDTSSDFI